MEEYKRIEDQLRRSIEGSAWHGYSLLELLADVSAEKAAAKPIATAHSIWEIVLHVSAWVNVARRRLGGDTAYLSPDQDWPKIPDCTPAAWTQTIKALEQNHADLCREVSQLGDARLSENATGQRYTIYFMLHGVAQHNLYHAGQIAILKKV